MIYDLTQVDKKYLQDVKDLCGLPQTYITTCNCEECGRSLVQMRQNTDLSKWSWYGDAPPLLVSNGRIPLIMESHLDLCNTCYDMIAIELEH